MHAYVRVCVCLCSSPTGNAYACMCMCVPVCKFSVTGVGKRSHLSVPALVLLLACLSVSKWHCFEQHFIPCPLLSCSGLSAPIWSTFEKIIIIPWHRTHQTFWRAAAWPAGLWPSSAGPGDVGSSTAAEASGWPVPASAPSGSHHWGRPPPLPPLAPGSLANTTKMLFMLHPLQSLSGVTPPCSLSSPWRKASREAVNYCRTCYERPASKSLKLRSQTQSSLVGSGHLNRQDFIQPQAKCFFFCFSPPCLLVKQASICCLKKGVPWFLYILHCFVLIVQKKRAGSGNPFLRFEKQQKLNKTPTYYD